MSTTNVARLYGKVIKNISWKFNAIVVVVPIDVYDVFQKTFPQIDLTTTDDVHRADHKKPRIEKQQSQNQEQKMPWMDAKTIALLNTPSQAAINPPKPDNLFTT